MGDCVTAGPQKPLGGRSGRKPCVYLTEAQVRALRARARRGHKARVLAHDFNVCQVTVRNIVRRKTRRRSPGRKRHTYLTPDRIRALRGRAQAGECLHALAAEFGVTWATAKNLRDGRTRRNVTC
jgi:transposase